MKIGNLILSILISISLIIIITNLTYYKKRSINLQKKEDEIINITITDILEKKIEAKINLKKRAINNISKKVIKKDSAITKDSTIKKTDNTPTKNYAKKNKILNNNKKIKNINKNNITKKRYSIYIPQPKYPPLAKQLNIEKKITITFYYFNHKAKITSHIPNDNLGFYNEILNSLKKIKVSPEPKETLKIKKEFLFKIK